MKVSLKWLQIYFDAQLPKTEEVADALTFHAFEIEESKGDLLDVKVLPNRAADCLSHRGIARELSAILNVSLKQDPLREVLPGWSTTNKLSVSVDDAKQCSRYIGALVSGVKVGPSPAWLKEALESVGQRSINNVVDATNYVMLNIGQPLHAFDAGKLEAKDGAYAIRVRESEEGETMTTLSGDEFALKKGMLVIADGNKNTPLGIAGVKGGKSSEISADTKDIILEAATFDGTLIRKTAQGLKLWTDASTRFQNRPSPELCAYGMRDVLALIKDIAGGELEGVVDVYPNPVPPYIVGASAKEVSQLLGREYTSAEVSDVLKRLGFSYREIESPREEIVALAEKCLGVPYKLGASVRRDAPRLFDCSSFTAWLLANVGIISTRVSVDQYLWAEKIEEKDLRPGDLVFINSTLGHVWYESHEYLPGKKVPEGVDHVALFVGDNTIIHARGGDIGKVIKESLTENVFYKNIVGFGRPRGIDDARFVIQVPFERTDLLTKEDVIEEVGQVIGYDSVPGIQLVATAIPVDQNKFKGIERIKDFLLDKGFTEISTQSFAKKGDVYLANPLQDTNPALRPNLSENMKEALEKAVHTAPLALGVQDIKLFEIGTVFSKEGESLSLALGYQSQGKKTKGYLKEVVDELLPLLSLPATCPIYGTKEDVVEIPLQGVQLEKLGEGYEPTKTSVGMYQAFSVYPFILRDIAVWVPEGTLGESVSTLITEKAGELLRRIDQFDTFTKEGKTSYAFRLVFQSFEQTLSDEAINKVMVEVTDALNSQSGWQVR